MQKKWIQFLLGLFLIVLFIFSAQLLNKNSAYHAKISKEIEQQGIEADALFYTESPKALEAGYLLDQKMKSSRK